MAAHSRKPRHQCFGGVCEHRGVRRSRFHPGRESSRSVGDHCDVIPNPSAAASQNVALYCRLGGMSDLEVFGRRSLAIVSVATRRAGDRPFDQSQESSVACPRNHRQFFFARLHSAWKNNPGKTPATPGTNGNNRGRAKPKLSIFQRYAGQ